MSGLRAAVHRNRRPRGRAAARPRGRAAARRHGGMAAWRHGGEQTTPKTSGAERRGAWKRFCRAAFDPLR
ncbi:hypothetical protein AQ778_24655 [Burkholderia pseudomallei]|nr:hypothetical protein AQ778_24655 [Burkholderia pseudomallei]